MPLLSGRGIAVILSTIAIGVAAKLLSNYALFSVSVLLLYTLVISNVAVNYRAAKACKAAGVEVTLTAGEVMADPIHSLSEVDPGPADYLTGIYGWRFAYDVENDPGPADARHRNTLPPRNISGANVAYAILTVKTLHRLPRLFLENPLDAWVRHLPGFVSSAARSSYRWNDDHRSPARRHVRPVIIPPLATGTTYRVRMPVPTQCRGIWILQPLLLWYEDPLRLFRRKVTSTARVYVTVLPRPDEPAEMPEPLTSGGARSLPDTSHASDTATMDMGEGDFFGLRPYVPGDRPTLLHWQSIASADIFLAREFASQSGGRLRLLIDNAVEETQAVGDTETAQAAECNESLELEAVVARAGSIGSAAIRSGLGLEILTIDGDRIVIPRSDTNSLTLLRELAVVYPSPTPLPAGSLCGVVRVIPAGKNTIMITSRNDPPDLSLLDRDMMQRMSASIYDAQWRYSETAGQPAAILYHVADPRYSNAYGTNPRYSNPSAGVGSQ